MEVLLMAHQEQRETDQVVRIGLELFHELGERIRKTEVANQSLRDALTQLAARVGVVAPTLVR